MRWRRRTMQHGKRSSDHGASRARSCRQPPTRAPPSPTRAPSPTPRRKTHIATSTATTVSHTLGMQCCKSAIVG
eukprot:3780557-Alexandrium_andersonii.AAC.1